MHFHLPSYLPYYSENDPEFDNDLDSVEDNEKEIDVNQEMEHPTFLSVMLVLGAAIGLVFMVALYT